LCRLAVAQQERLDRLLAAAVEELNPAPAGLAGRTAQRLRRRRVRRTAGLVGAGLAAALVLAGLVGRSLHREAAPREPTPPERSAALPVQGSQSPDTEAVADVRVRVGPATDTLTVPVRTTNPHLTIVWAYPGLRQGPSAGALESNPDQE
jgi:ferric-dicitrate binding protein FerR (iron transport regulator)